MKKLNLITIVLCVIILFSSCAPSYNREISDKKTVNENYGVVYSRGIVYYEQNGHKPVTGLDRNHIFVPCGETAEEFLARTQEDAVELVDGNKNLIKGDSPVATGNFVTGAQHGDYIVVPGDVNGDAYITDDDVALAEKYAKNEEKASMIAYALAADVDLSGVIDDDDVKEIKKAVRSSGKSNQWFIEAKEHFKKSIFIDYDFCSTYVEAVTE